MKINKLFFLISLFLFSISHSEYLVFQNTGKEILPITDEKENEKIYTILQIYQWPMITVMANKVEQKELAELTKFVSEAAEEKFLRKKIKEISPQYDIAFIPTFFYEIFTIFLKNSNIFFKHSKQSPPYGSAQDINQDINYIKLILSDCSLSDIDEDIAEIIYWETNSIQDIYNYYLKVNFKEEFLQLHGKINNALLKFLLLNTKARTDNIQNQINIHIYDLLKFIIESSFLPWKIKFLYDEVARKKIIDLEYEARKKNIAVLYRGGRARNIYIIGTKGQEVPIEGSFLATKRAKSVPATPAPTHEQLVLEFKTKGESTKIRDWQQPLNSVSYGNSVFSGFFCDSSYAGNDTGACSCDYLDKAELIGYALFINKEKYISGKLGLLFISPLNTLASLMGKGEFFHSRTKAFITKKYFIDYGGQVNVPGLFLQDFIFIDNAGIFAPIGDPLEKAKELSEFIQLNARILKLPDNEGGFNTKPEAEMSYRKAQIDLTNMLKAMVITRKYLRQKRESGKEEKLEENK
ncbi:hypothetical protein M1446_05125 [Candidatus Dependentiae bacterium]|nr:hypothetical protein [Candidatus Dependentiae bacterium]